MPNKWPDPATYDEAFIGPIQWLSGVTNASDAPPFPWRSAIYYNRTTGFQWTWNVSRQAWVAIPKAYKALLTQAGTNAPVATVLENTLVGVPVWSRTNVGQYTLTLANAFPTSKTFITIGGTLTVDSTIDSGYVFDCVMASNTSSALKLETGTVSGAGSDDLLFNTPIEILVYP